MKPAITLPLGNMPDPGLAEDFKGAMRRLTGSVALVCTRDDHGAPIGMAATAVTSVSTEPPALMVCINRSASLYTPLLAHGCFSVNLLDVEQAQLVAVFAGAVKGSARFAHGIWNDMLGVPCLADAQANIVCHVEQSVSYGSHELIIGRVQTATHASTVNPLLWQNGAAAAAAPLKQLSQF